MCVCVCVCVCLEGNKKIISNSMKNSRKTKIIQI